MQRAIASRLSRSDLTTTLAQTLRRTATKTTETYITYGLTEHLFKACSLQADYTIPEDQRGGVLTGKGPAKTASGEDLGIPAEGRENAWWFTDLGLSPTFSTWSQVAYIHMYLLTVRLRALESHNSFQNYQRYLLEHFSHAAEDKMIILHNMGARGIRNRYLKDLFLQWRGILAAYDEGMVNGDAALAGAVWRNLWKGDEDVDWTKVASVVAWMRGVVSVLAQMDVQALVGNLEGKQGLFESVRADTRRIVAQESQGVTEKFV
jgi:cytochrome b pre-mRNA-processing protein 3